MPINTGQFELDPAETAALLSRSRDYSFVTRFARQIPVARAGTRVPVMDQDISGGWVNEGAAKPVVEDTVSYENLVVRKWAGIATLTQEVARENPHGVMEVVRDKLAAAYARAVDTLALTGSGISGATYINQTTKSVTLGTAAKADGSIFTDVNNGLKLLSQDGRDLDGFIFDRISEPVFNGAVDTAGRPLFVDTPLVDSNPVYRPGRLLGRPAELIKDIRTGSGATQVLGYGGDWSRVFWGQYSGFTVDINTTASYTVGGVTHSAYQENLVLIRAEAEIGVLVLDPEDFVKYTAGTSLS